MSSPGACAGLTLLCLNIGVPNANPTLPRWIGSRDGGFAPGGRGDEDPAVRQVRPLGRAARGDGGPATRVPRMP